MVLSGHPPPRGHFLVPLVPAEEHGIKGPVFKPPGGPQGGTAQPPIHLHHQGEGLTPQGVRNCVPVPGPIALGPLRPPCRLRLRLLRLWCRRLARPPRRRGSSHPRRVRPRLSCRGSGAARGAVVSVGGRLVGGSGGYGGDQVPRIGVDVVEVGVVVVVAVVDVVCRHLPDTGRDAPHRLDVRLRGRPAPGPPPCALTFPYFPHTPPCLSPGAYAALAPLAPGPPPRPLAPELGALPPLCPLARGAGPDLCYPRPCPFR